MFLAVKSSCKQCGGDISPNDEKVSADCGEYHLECAEALGIEPSEE